MLDAFSRSGDPDAALAALDAALGRMTAAVELFSILRSNAQLRELFGDILGSAPRLANVIATRPHVLDGAIDPARATLIAEGLDESAIAAPRRRLCGERGDDRRARSTARAISPPRKCF